MREVIYDKGKEVSRKIDPLPEEPKVKTLDEKIDELTVKINTLLEKDNGETKTA